MSNIITIELLEIADDEQMAETCRNLGLSFNLIGDGRVGYDVQVTGEYETVADMLAYEGFMENGETVEDYLV